MDELEFVRRQAPVVNEPTKQAWESARHSLHARIAQDSQVRSRRWRPVALRVGVVTAVAVVAVTVLSLVAFGSGGPSIVGKALAAVTTTSGSVLHVKIVGSESDGSGKNRSWTEEKWYTSTVPYKYRGTVADADTGVREGAFDDATGLYQLYDAASNTIYRVQMKPGESVPQAPDGVREQILSLLASGLAKEDGHETVDGRDAVRILANGVSGTDQTGKGRETVYLVDAKTGDPIEWRTTNGGQTLTLRFAVYEQLPATPQNLALLDLPAQHTSATLDTDPQHYYDHLNVPGTEDMY